MQFSGWEVSLWGETQNPPVPPRITHLRGFPFAYISMRIATSEKLRHNYRAAKKWEKCRNFINHRSLRARERLRVNALTPPPELRKYILDKSMLTTWKIDFKRTRCSYGPVNTNVIIDTGSVIHSRSRNWDNAVCPNLQIFNEFR